MKWDRFMEDVDKEISEVRSPSPPFSHLLAVVLMQ